MSLLHPSPGDPRLRARIESGVLLVTAVLVALIFAGVVRAVTVGTEQRDAQRRDECVTAYRIQWQNAIGDVVLTAAEGHDPTVEEVEELEHAQTEKPGRERAMRSGP